MNSDISFSSNMAVEFLGAVYRYVNEDKLERYNFKKNKDLQEWAESINENISPFLENDLKLVKKVDGIIWPLIKKSIREKIDGPEEFFRFLKEMDPEKLVTEYINNLTLDDYEPGRKDDIDYILDNYFEDQKKLSFIKNIVKNPEELKERLYIALNSFYRKFFKERVEETEDILEEKISQHRDMYNQDNDLFFNKMLGYVKDSDSEEHNSINLLVLWHAEIYNFSFTIEDDLYLMYGFALEQRINDDIVEKKSRDFFKVLADKKRYEILKLLADKNWYARELAEYFEVTTATISYHLSRLHDLGIISFREGEKNRVYYNLKRDNLKDLFQSSLEFILKDSED